jgi:hypothetical protein
MNGEMRGEPARRCGGMKLSLPCKVAAGLCEAGGFLHFFIVVPD